MAYLLFFGNLTTAQAAAVIYAAFSIPQDAGRVVVRMVAY